MKTLFLRVALCAVALLAFVSWTAADRLPPRIDVASGVTVLADGSVVDGFGLRHSILAAESGDVLRSSWEGIDGVIHVVETPKPSGSTTDAWVQKHKRTVEVMLEAFPAKQQSGGSFHGATALVFPAWRARAA